MTLPTREKIVAAQEKLLQSLEVDDPSTECWACGKYHPRLERAHVVAKAFGGSDDPDNFFLLCSLCHVEQPDAQSREAQETWLRERDAEVTRNWNDTFRVMEPLLVGGLNRFWKAVYSDCMIPVVEKTSTARMDKRTWLANVESRTKEVRAALDKVRSCLGDDYEGPRVDP